MAGGVGTGRWMAGPVWRRAGDRAGRRTVERPSELCDRDGSAGFDAFLTFTSSITV